MSMVYLPHIVGISAGNVNKSRRLQDHGLNYLQHEEIVRPGSRHPPRTLGVLLPLHLVEIVADLSPLAEEALDVGEGAMCRVPCRKSTTRESSLTPTTSTPSTTPLSRMFSAGMMMSASPASRAATAHRLHPAVEARARLI